MLSTRSVLAVTVTTVAGLAVAYVLELPLAAGFSFGLLLLAFKMWRGGLAPGELWRESRQGALHAREVIFILLAVSLLLPTWSAIGTIDAMIALGLRWFDPAHFLTGAFLLSGVIAFILGTSTGTLSAVGIPVMGMAAELGIPLSMTAGALVSGAFVGDRGSPFSSAFRLTADSAGVEPQRLARAKLPTTLLGLASSVVFFTAADRFGGWEDGAPDAKAAALGALPAAGDLWLYLPPVLLVAAMLLRLGIRWAFLLAIASGIGIGIGHTGIPAGEWPALLWFGWTDDTGHTAKGMLHMIDLMVLIALAGAFNGLLERSGGIEPIVRKWFASDCGLPGATWRAGLFGLGLGLVSCTQTLPIMMTGRHLRSIWGSRFGHDHLGRVVADTSLLFAALVPWNMLAILCGTLLGVPVMDYVPFAVYVWSIPLFTLLYSIWRNHKAKRPARDLVRS
jgi:NhaC family Na+:H+ antiporter